MDSKSPDANLDSTIYLASNVWTRPDGEEPSPWEAAEYVPGDLRVHFHDVSTLDVRVLPLKLNRAQLDELWTYRFFLPFGSDVETLSGARCTGTRPQDPA